MIFAAAAIPTVLAVGVSTDMARTYLAQSRLSMALDAAALAVSSSSGTSGLTPNQLVTDYLKADFPGVAITSNINAESNSMIISATATIPTTFMRMASIPTITVSATTQVGSTGYGSLEMALVLDNTGSLGSDGIAALKSAAVNLVTPLFGSTPTNNPSIRVALVPYVAAVNAGSIAPSLVQSPPPLTPTNATGWTGCLVERPSTFNNFSATLDYKAVAKDLDSPPSVAGYLTPYHWASDPVNKINVWKTTADIKPMPWTRGDSGPGPNASCPTPIIPLTNNLSDLLTAIDLADDNMGGMEAWNDGGTVGSIGMAWAYRVLSPKGPFTGVEQVSAWNTPHVQKIVVLMTDGTNQIDNGGADGCCGGDYTGFGPWQQTFLRSNGFYTTIDTQEEAVCDALKANGATIYAIYFSSSTSVHPALQYCAGTQVGVGDPAYYQQPSTTTALGQSFGTLQTKLRKIRIMQ